MKNQLLLFSKQASEILIFLIYCHVKDLANDFEPMVQENIVTVISMRHSTSNQHASLQVEAI